MLAANAVRYLKIEGPDAWAVSQTATTRIDVDGFAEGRLLRVFVGENDNWHGKPLADAIVAMLRDAHVAGASVFRAVEGFGSHHEIHVQRVWSFRLGMPILIEVVDTAERIESVMSKLDEMVGEGLITLERVSFRRYASSEKRR